MQADSRGRLTVNSPTDGHSRLRMLLCQGGASVAATALLLGLSINNAESAGQNHLTGCFIPGQSITKTAFGDKPKTPCAVNQKIVTLSRPLTNPPLGVRQTTFGRSSRVSATRHWRMPGGKGFCQRAVNRVRLMA